MGRIYTVEFENAAILNSEGTVDVFEIKPAANKMCWVRHMKLAVISETGDAAEEILRLRWIRGHTTSATGGASPTPRPTNPNDGAAGFTAITVADVIAVSGTPVNLESVGLNVRIPSPDVWTPGTELGVNAGQTLLSLRLMAAVADDLTISGTLYVEED